MEKRVLEYIKKYRMIEAGDRIVTGVSGGADSICLFMILLKLRKAIPFEISVVHVNHSLREEAKRDAAFIEEICRKYRVAYQEYVIDVKHLADTSHMTLEEAGRTARYKTFYDFLKKWKGNKIALAHHQNDVAETFLYHLARGSGLGGLCSLRPVRDNIIRPLLCVEREEIEQYLEKKNICYQTDSTNFTLDYTRNKIRHQVIHYLQNEINVRTVSHIAQTQEALQEAEEYISDSAGKLFYRYVTQEEGKIRIQKELFCQEAIMQKYVLRQCIREAAGGLKNITRKHLQMIMELTSKEVGKEVCLPNGIQVQMTYQELIITTDSHKDRHIVKSQTAAAVHWEIIPYKNQMIPEKKYTKWLDYDKIENGLEIRTRRSGDYLTVNREGGTKKLKDYFIDCKIPREEREQIVLAADGSHILWVIGYRISEFYKVSNQTKRVIKIQADGG